MTLTYKQYPTITEGAQTIVTPLVSEEIYVRKLHGGCTKAIKSNRFHIYGL